MPVDAAGVLEAESPAARFGADTASVPEADRAVHSGEGTEAGPEAHGDNRFVQVVGHRKADDFDFGYKGTGDTVYNKDLRLYFINLSFYSFKISLGIYIQRIGLHTEPLRSQFNL